MRNKKSPSNDERRNCLEWSDSGERVVAKLAVAISFFLGFAAGRFF